MLEARNLVKRFFGVAVVDDVSLIVRPGEVVGCLGPNGSGKTTIRDSCEDSNMAAVNETGPTMESAPISGLVPMIHVGDVERSAEFYRLLGFEIGNDVPPAGPMYWAWLYAPKAADWKRGPNLMLTRSACPIDASAQEVCSTYMRWT